MKKHERMHDVMRRIYNELVVAAEMAPTGQGRTSILQRVELLSTLLHLHESLYDLEPDYE